MADITSEAVMTRSNGQIMGGATAEKGASRSDGGGRTSRRKRMGANLEEEEESLTEEDTQALAAVAEAEFIRRHVQPKESTSRSKFVSSIELVFCPYYRSLFMAAKIVFLLFSM